MTYLKKGYLIAIILLASCQTKVQFEQFDAAAWQSDRNGCTGLRTTLLPDLLLEKDKLTGLNQPSLSRVLGRPDHQELYVRNQKFFVYFIDPSEACRDQSGEEQPRQLHIRFNATGKVNEVSVQY